MTQTELDALRARFDEVAIDKGFSTLRVADDVYVQTLVQIAWNVVKALAEQEAVQKESADTLLPATSVETFDLPAFLRRTNADGTPKESAAEPVAWYRYEGGVSPHFDKGWYQRDKPERNGIPLYAHPAPPSDEARAQVAKLNQWRECVIDQLIVGCIYCGDHDDDPRKAISDLISWEVTIALDPSVSSEARTLVSKHTAKLEAELAALKAELANERTMPRTGAVIFQTTGAKECGK